MEVEAKAKLAREKVQDLANVARYVFEGLNKKQEFESVRFGIKTKKG